MLNDNTLDNLLENGSFWKDLGPYNDVVLSSKIILCRNIYNLSFPHRQDEQEANYINTIVKKFSTESELCDDINIVYLDKISAVNKKILNERNIVTDDMTQKNNCSVISGTDDSFNILVNENDHFKIHVSRPGLQLDDALNKADQIDNELNNMITYAYSEDTGYITSNPANLGTGLIASCMLHLPILTLCKKLSEVIKIAQENELVLNGIRDEGKKTFGNIYQLANNSSKGTDEKIIIKKLHDITLKILNFECSARDDYFLKYQIYLEDKIFRSLGVIKYARKLDFSEAMNSLSDIRLGIILSLIKDIDLRSLNDLMIKCQWTHLEKIANTTFTDISECNIFRADFLREQLEWSSIYG